MGYRQPNRTKTFFQQVNAGRPAAARQKLGAAEGATSVVKAQAQAQGQENTTVQNQSTQVANIGEQGFDNLSGFAKVDERLDQGAKFVNTPTLGFRTQVNTTGQTPTVVGAGTGAAKITGADQAGVDKTADTEATRSAAYNQELYNEFESTGKGLTGMTTEDLTNELGQAYQEGGKQLDAATTAMTEGNLGRLADESAFEREQEQLARVLADRESNIGKLRALYGVGYDTGKYGALDSNILQGQFNELQGQSATALEEKEKVQRAGDKVRQSYLDTVESSKTKLDESKVKAEERITKLGEQLSAMDVEIEKRIATEGGNLTEATKKLIASRDKVKGDYKKAVDAATKKASDDNKKVAADRAAKAAADAEHAKKNTLSAKLRDGFGIELNPMKATENEIKYWSDLVDRAERGDPAAIAQLAFPVAGFAGRVASIAKPIAKGVVNNVRDLFGSSKDTRTDAELGQAMVAQREADARLIERAQRTGPKGAKYKVVLNPRTGQREAVIDYSGGSAGGKGR